MSIGIIFGFIQNVGLLNIIIFVFFQVFLEYIFAKKFHSDAMWFLLFAVLTILEILVYLNFVWKIRHIQHFYLLLEDLLYQRVLVALEKLDRIEIFIIQKQEAIEPTAFLEIGGNLNQFYLLVAQNRLLKLIFPVLCYHVS